MLRRCYACHAARAPDATPWRAQQQQRALLEVRIYICYHAICRKNAKTNAGICYSMHMLCTQEKKNGGVQQQVQRKEPLGWGRLVIAAWWGLRVRFSLPEGGSLSESSTSRKCLFECRRVCSTAAGKMQQQAQCSKHAAAELHTHSSSKTKQSTKYMDDMICFYF